MKHPPGTLQRVELAFASSDGDLLRAQLGLGLLQAGLQRNLLVQQHVFLPAPLAHSFLQSGQVSLQFGDLVLPSKNRRRRLAGTVAVRVAAGINSVPAEEFAEIERIAAQAGVPVGALIRGWVLAGLAAERGTSLRDAIEHLAEEAQRLRRLAAVSEVA